MSWKDLLSDFLNFAFLIILIFFCIVYFITGDNFTVFSRFVESILPLIFFGIIFLVRLKITRSELKKRKSNGETEVTLHLDATDKLLSDIVVFFTPILLGLIIYKARGVVSIIDLTILIAVFLIMFFWQRHLFSKER